jgi:predicted choloylglycine hydrolase
MRREFEVTFTAFDEEQPGEKWRSHFEASREKWAASLGSASSPSRPSATGCREAIATHMPELLESHDRRVALFDGDPAVAQHVSYWGGPPLFSGCSVLALPGPPATLLRSYDFTEAFFDALICRTKWTGKRVLAMCEGAGGCNDGINEDGLAAALTFGGRFAHGLGFAVPMLVRYVLETCATVGQAVTALQRLPSAGVQNIILQDRSGASAVVYLRPDGPTGVSYEPMVTNHQEIPPPTGGDSSQSATRKACLARLRNDPPDKAFQAFMDPPLHHADFSRWFGTLYTARYEPGSGRASYHWKAGAWEQSMDRFEEGRRAVRFTEETV